GARLAEQILELHLPNHLEESDLLIRVLSRRDLPVAHHCPCEQIGEKHQEPAGHHKHRSQPYRPQPNWHCRSALTSPSRDAGTVPGDPWTNRDLNRELSGTSLPEWSFASVAKPLRSGNFAALGI